MKETYNFKSIKSEVLEKKEKDKIKPITKEKENKPLTLKDHFMSLRSSIQERIKPIEQSEEEIRDVKLLSELITPELMNSYSSIIKQLKEKSSITEEHKEREFINLEEEEISESIEQWIKALIEEVKANKEVKFKQEDFEELEAQSWLLFESLSNVLNTKSIERDIRDFNKENNFEDLDINIKEQNRLKKELLENLDSRYPIKKEELEILIDLFEGKDEEQYNLKILIETISRLWNQYELSSKKKNIAKISLGNLLSKGAESFAPSLFENIMSGGNFNLAVFLEYFGLNKISLIIGTKTQIELVKVTKEINEKVNERITDSLFFQEFEFMHEKPLGEIYSTLQRGKSSTENLLSSVISKFAPHLAGISMSLAFLTKINPALGGIGLAGLPAMYMMAKKQNKKIWPMYEKEKREGEKISTRLNAVKTGFEEIKTSSDVPQAKEYVKEQLDRQDKLYLARAIEELKMRLRRMIPFDVATVVSAGTGSALQQMGVISGGAVLSNIIYSEHLNRPVQQLVNLYFNEFSRYVQDVQRMEEVLGEYEKLDLPEGDKEKNRISVGELDNFNISVEKLKFKNILKDVNLEIKQGEFLTISGTTGGGKSTLLRNLVGLYKPDSGEVKIGNTNLEKIKKYGDESIFSIMSYCNQNPQIFEGMSLRENMLLWTKQEKNDKDLKQILKDLHLDKFINKLDDEIKTFSGGEKVRLGLARTLIKGPKIMLLDEPTSSLDSRSAAEIIEIIKEVHNKYPETTIICVSHDDQLIKSGSRSVDITQL